MAPPIAFGVTTKALLAGRKTRTTRDWSADYALRYRQGDLVAAWDKLNGGHPVGHIRISRQPYKQKGSEMPESAYEREGFAYLDRSRPLPTPKGVRPGMPFWRALFERWRREDKEQWVIEFTVVPEGRLS